MPCRVGMTTNPQRRKSEHENDVRNLRNWQIIASGLTREEAAEREQREAQTRGCDRHGGGADPDRPREWSVYYFQHDGKK